MLLRMGMLTVKANAPVLGMRDGHQYDVADSPFIRKVIEARKLTLLADHSFVEESWGDDPAGADGGQEEKTGGQAASAGKVGKR
ncbi:hypothetical protein [Nonomuraea sp. NPDC052265]|uniref:hypothetical protein n=1 Tax=Nonomuraea sp. NPDC052265 TaxID=3364374 RepID=UPI0037C63455